MLFGLPWFALIPIIAIVGGLVLAYKEKELKLEEKRLTSSKESNELRKMILNLKNRVENLESIITESEEKRVEVPLDEIEIKNDLEDGERGNRSTRVRG
ncbi:MAG: hypothetical protein RLN81_14535 [Balneolaceae bacterium]